MSEIQIWFILPDNINQENGASQIMSTAFESCKELVNSANWIRKSDLEGKKLTKFDYVIFENFDGIDFRDLLKTECAILGPLAISACVSEGKSIPNFNWPIFNVTLYGCVLTCSNLSKEEKNLIKQKVQLMGGICSDDFTENVTHLICGKTISEKYKLAAEMGIKILLPEWIDNVWKESQMKYVNATSEKILTKYQCPIFHKLIICTTGVTDRKQKSEISSIINTNGGTLEGKLKCNETDILICMELEGNKSDKFKAAQSRRLPCVTIDWLHESVNKGYALPFSKYLIKGATSTPTKESENMKPNFSCISEISVVQKLSIDESSNFKTSKMISGAIGLRSGKNRQAVHDSGALIEKLDLRKVKRAGNLLEGCSIYLAGFTNDQREKLNKILNFCGAIRYDELTDRITHLIVENDSCNEIKKANEKGLDCYIVSINWLVDSLEKHQLIKVDDYLIGSSNLTDYTFANSPTKKKTYNMLKKSTTHTNNIEVAPTLSSIVEQQGDDDNSDNEDPFTQQYLQDQQTKTTEKETEDTLAMWLNHQAESVAKLDINNDQGATITENFPTNYSKIDSDSITQDDSTENDPMLVFRNLTFILDGFQEHDEEVLKIYIKRHKGVIINKNDCQIVPDYAVVPVLDWPTNLPKTKTIVSQFYIVESVEEEKLLDISYYHKPLTLPKTKPLKDCVITLSNYTGKEREFLYLVIEGLGAVCQEQFSKKCIPAQNILASTHLITSVASGRKYDAAIKWKRPAVTKDWLLQCLRTGEKLPLDTFLPGNELSTRQNVTNRENENEKTSSRIHNVLVTPKSATIVTTTSIASTTIKDNDTYFQANPAKRPRIDTTVSNATPPVTPLRKIVDYDRNKSVSKTHLQRLNQLESAPTPPGKTPPVTPLRKIIEDFVAKKLIPESHLERLNQLELASTPVATCSKPKEKENIDDLYPQCSQISPVTQQNIDDIIRNINLEESSSSEKSYYPWAPKTPDTPLGAFIRENPSPRLRKEMLVYLNSFPEFVPPKRRLSTPLSELKKRLHDKLLGIGEYASNSEESEEQPNVGRHQPTTSSAIATVEDSINSPVQREVDEKYKKLQEIVKSSGSGPGGAGCSSTSRSRIDNNSKKISRKLFGAASSFDSVNDADPIETAGNEIQSQACTVDWDYERGGETEKSPTDRKVFLISGIEKQQRELYSKYITELGAQVSDLQTYDPNCTHLICIKPVRNEKTLASIAAGKWILHFSYIEESAKAKKFFNEEEFEFGNPKSKRNIFYDTSYDYVHYWRKEIMRRGYGAFHGVRAVIAAEKNESLIKVVEAGDGVIVHAKPPFDGPIHATHCFLETNKPDLFPKYVPLAKQGIKCFSTLYIHDFLRTAGKADSDNLPYFKNFL